MATKKKRPIYLVAVENVAGEGSARSTAIEQTCLRLELCWKRRPDLRLGELITHAQSFALAAQRDLTDEALLEAVERYVGVRS